VAGNTSNEIASNKTANTAIVAAGRLSDPALARSTIRFDAGTEITDRAGVRDGPRAEAVEPARPAAAGDESAAETGSQGAEGVS